MNPTTVNEARIDAWLERLATETDEARHSAAFTAYLQAMAKFWRYSRNNSILILMQCPTAAYVNSRKRWAELGYRIKEEHQRNAIQILCPHFRLVTNQETGEKEEVLTHFSTGYVYADMQVVAGPNAAPLAAPWSVIAGDYSRLFDVLAGVCAALKIHLDRRPLKPALGGYFQDDPRQIVLNETADMGNCVHTLIHELAHAVLHAYGVGKTFSTQERECQAEATAYCVAEALGLPSPNSPTYMALYRVDKVVISANAYAIQGGVKTILAQIERALAISHASGMAA